MMLVRASLAILALTFTAPGLALAQSPPVEAEKDEPKRGPGTERDEECLVCHAGVGEEEAPKLDLERYQNSQHAEEGCVGCHPDVEDPDIEHEKEDEDLGPAACGSCHEGPDAELAESHHAGDIGEEARAKNLEQPTCSSCHGGHYIVEPTDPQSMVHPVNQVETCGECHGKQREAAGHTLQIPEQYREAVANGDPEVIRTLMEEGKIVKATCADCHGAHDVRPSTKPGSMLWPTQVLGTCGECHEEPKKEFANSAHHEAAQKEGFEWAGPPNLVDAEEAQPPVCTTCHQMHDWVPPSTDKFRLDLIHECGTCHAHLMDTYVESYHGKATLLGDVAVAKCSDCHGYHEILPPENPASMVSPERKLETCQECHEGAPPAFASFYAHADAHDREGFPVLYWVYTFMTTLLVSVFAFFGLHTLLWAIREGVDAVKEGGFLPKKKHGGPRVARFNAFDRMLHFFVIISFLGLAATGAPLKFAEASWAKGVFQLMGGVDGAGLIHRILAVVTFGYFFTHIISMARRFWQFKQEGVLGKKLLGPDSLVPGPRDVIDVIRNFRWFLGLGPKPTWERWTYWEKFDYWAVFWGVAIIGTSGLVLWFPTAFTHVIPGWLVNVALVVHSDEALLAIGFIFGVHFFNSHLRRAKFPMDEVIFTGTVPADEYKEERGLEWARLEKEGKLEERSGKKAPDPRFRAVAQVFGILAWLTGLVILGLIVHGFITT